MRFNLDHAKLHKWWKVNAVYKEHHVAHQSPREIERRKEQVRRGMLHPVHGFSERYNDAYRSGRLA